MSVVGGISEEKGVENSNEIDELARFAVDEYNREQNTQLKFERVLDAIGRIVDDGIIYDIKLDAANGGIMLTYKAKVWVWVMPLVNRWESQTLKILLEFKPVDAATSVPVGISEAKGVENGIDELARFAVDEHNREQNTQLKFWKVLHAKEHIVDDDIIYDITLDAADGGLMWTYEAKVWVQPSRKLKKLLEFNIVDPRFREPKSVENSLVIEELARFAVDEHNKKQNTLLEFGRILNAKEQIFAGKLYYITLEATDGGVKKTYEAKVWVKPWENFKELQEFKPVDVATSVPGGKFKPPADNSLVIEELARFAVNEHNRKQNTLLEFGGVLDAMEQIVAGTVYYITLEATDGGVKNNYDAKVWLKLDNSKELLEFKRLLVLPPQHKLPSGQEC